MKERGLSYHDIANITGHSYNSVKSMLQPNQELPRWVKLVLYVWANLKTSKGGILESKLNEIMIEITKPRKEITQRETISRAMHVIKCPKCGSICASASEMKDLPNWSICRNEECDY